MAGVWVRVLGIASRDKAHIVLTPNLICGTLAVPRKDTIGIDSTRDKGPFPFS